MNYFFLSTVFNLFGIICLVFPHPSDTEIKVPTAFILGGLYTIAGVIDKGNK